MNNQKSAPLMNENIKLEQDMKGVAHFARYDEGLKTFLKEFFVGDVVIAPADEFWEFYIKNTENNIALPAISLFPESYVFNSENNSFTRYQLGDPIQKRVDIINEDNNVKEGSTVLLSKMARALYYDITYQINIWGLNRDDTLQLLQEILFPLYQHSEYQISYFGENYSIPYQIGSDIINNSQMGINQNGGTLYRYTISLNITAPIFDSKNYYNVTDSHTTIRTELGPERNENESIY